MINLRQWIKNKILKFLGLERLSDDPNSSRYTFINNDNDILLKNIQANKVWLSGDGNEIQNFYLNEDVKGFYAEPIYNKNKRNYFWSKSVTECDIKRVHSGIPNAIVTTLCNIIGTPNIRIKDTKKDAIWDSIVEENDLMVKLVQQGRPLTLAVGFGAWKPNINTKISKYPLWEYVDGEFIEYIYKSGLLMGIVFKSYYKDDKNNNYVLIETRYKDIENSYIKYNLFKLKKGEEGDEVSLDSIPQLAELEDVVIPNCNKILAVPSRYFYDASNSKIGRSIFTGKLDLFDMLDEIWSQASQTNRVSTPVEYYNPDIIGKGPNGINGMPKLYNRQFIQKSGIPDGDGKIDDDIVTTQPDLNFDKYGGLAKDVLDYILTGVLSPATLGIEVARKDNATAQREKEKISILTRNNIIASETQMLRSIINLSLMIKEYIDTGIMQLLNYDIDVKYTEFANPSFENEIQILGNAWVNGEISTQKYVDLLWGDKLSEEEKLKEVAWLDSHKEQEGDLFGTGTDEFRERNFENQESDSELQSNNVRISQTQPKNQGDASKVI